MNDDVLEQLQGSEPIIPEFDPALDALYKMLVATAKQFDWTVPERVEWERAFKAEMAGKIQR